MADDGDGSSASTGAELKPLEGKVAMGEGFGCVADLASYRACGPACKEIAGKVRATIPRTFRKIVLIDSLEFWLGPRIRDQVQAQLARLETAVDAQLKVNDRLLEESRADSQRLLGAEIGAIVAGLGTVSELLGKLAGVVGYIRGEYQLAGRAVTIPVELVRAELSKALRGGEHPPEVTERFPARVSVDILQRFENLLKEYARLSLTAGELAALLRSSGSGPGSQNPTTDAVSRALEATKALLAAFEKSSKELTQPPEGADLAPLLAAAIWNPDDLSDTAFLRVTVLPTRADIMVRRALLRRHDWKRVSVWGAFALAYSVFDSEGRVLDSGSALFLGRSAYPLWLKDSEWGPPNIIVKSAAGQA